jgi:NAD(P)-dependent dehydrogenase (short-subunit alcohol dehydrogenase family)
MQHSEEDEILRLAGKVALVTGAARGLGRACAVSFAKNGADVVLLDLARNLPGVPYPLGSESQLDYTAELCRKQGVASLAMPVDVRDLNAIEQAVHVALERFSRIDILLSSAGIAAPSGKITHEISEIEWQLMIDIDLTGAWKMMRAVGPSMIARRAGSIINVSSTAGMVGYRNFAAYVAAKHGIIGLTRAAALDYAPLKVRVNALCPGSVRDNAQVEGRMLSEIARSLEVPVEDHEGAFVRAQPMNTLIEPDDVAFAAVWLASDESRQVTGSVLAVDGGFTTH